MIVKINKYLHFPFYTVDNKITCRCCKEGKCIHQIGARTNNDNDNNNGRPKVVRRQRKSVRRLNNNERAKRK